MADYKERSRRRRELFESLASDFRNMREWIPHCCGKPLQPPHRAGCTEREFSWLCGTCGKYYEIDKKEKKELRNPKHLPPSFLQRIWS